MTDRPIPFSPPMVRALLDGRKTMTRRILKPPAPFVETDEGLDVLLATGQMRAPYAPGDRLWVKEAWRTSRAYDDLSPSEMSGEEPIQYEAGPIRLPLQDGRYRHARFMPRWASRITLIVTDVRVERLQDISEEDAIAEGVVDMGRRDGAPYSHCIIPGMPEITMEHEPSTVFAHLWEHIHGYGSWKANPFVAVYGFRPVLANIDQTEPTHD